VCTLLARWIFIRDILQFAYYTFGKKVTVHLALVTIGHLNKISTVHYFFFRSQFISPYRRRCHAAATTASLQVACSQHYTACTKRADYNNNTSPPPVYRVCIYLLFFYYNFFLLAFSARMVSTGPVDRLRRVTGYTDDAAADICAWFRIGGAWGRVMRTVFPLPGSADDLLFDSGGCRLNGVRNLAASARAHHLTDIIIII